jgi:hypothetical protein
MKKSTTIFLVFIGLIFLAGCGGQQQPTSQSQPAGQESAVQQPAQKNSGVSPAPKEGPKEVAEKYANYTLMTFPADSQAKKYLATDLQAKFDTPGFVPQSYGIQDTPSSITVGEDNVSGNKAAVKVIGQFGQSQVIWEFTLGNFNNEWKISKISKK